VVYSDGKSLKDDETLTSVGLSKAGKLYFRDLGPQVGWTTVSFVMLILRHILTYSEISK